MIVKLWSVDRLHLCFNYHSEFIVIFSFLFKMLFASIFLFMRLTHIQVLKKEGMKLE